MYRKIVSVIIPVFNESKNIPLIYSAVRSVFDNDLKEFHLELLFVDDGSKDSSVEVIRDIQLRDPDVRLAEFSRNFGKEAATSAGLEIATGDASIMIDADMQHPPSLIPQFIRTWELGSDVVVGIRKKNKSQGLIKTILSKSFYRLMHLISDVYMESGETDFRLLDRAVVDSFKKLPERQRMTRSLINWLGYTRSDVYFEADERAHGVAGYSFIKLARLALHTIVSNSLFPLRITGYLGILISFTSLLVGTTVFVQRYIFDDILGWHISGAAQLSILLVFLVGIILVALGMIALYIENIHKETLARPLYVLRRSPERKTTDVSSKKKIGVCFSAFDLLHPGHAAMLADARSRCDYLIVGIQSDPTVDVEYRSKTGSKNKPIYSLEERIEMIKSIKYVDEYFVYTTENELHAWLLENKWDIRILGSDWEGKSFTGHDINNGEIYFHKRTHNLSSTEIRRRLSSLNT